MGVMGPVLTWPWQSQEKVDHGTAMDPLGVRSYCGRLPCDKPAWNYQALLETVVMSRLDQVGKEIQAIEDTLSMRLSEKPPIPELHSLFLSPPEMKIKLGIRGQCEYRAKHINYAENEARNRMLGRRGGEFVFSDKLPVQEA